jgi:hypothetical protein
VGKSPITNLQTTCTGNVPPVDPNIENRPPAPDKLGNQPLAPTTADRRHADRERKGSDSMRRFASRRALT